jgi:hypothetical protein
LPSLLGLPGHRRSQKLARVAEIGRKRMNITIHRKCRDIDGALLVQMLARAAERQAKANLLYGQEAEREVKPSRWPWILIGLVATYFSIHVLVAVIKALLR